VKIALVDATQRPVYYPAGLLKIGAWQKSLGHECTLHSKSLPREADEIWVSVVFTFDIPAALGLIKTGKERSNTVRVGGIAPTLMPWLFEDPHIGLVPEAEEFCPDYGLVDKQEYSIVWMSRGCVRNCDFCAVRKLEPNFTNVSDWEGCVNTRKVVAYDNNWLAKPMSDLKGDVEKMLQGDLVVDFNQGLDCRLLTEKKADLLAAAPIRPIRFAFDGMQENGYYQDAVRLMHKKGKSQFITYTLYNFTDTPQDFYYRLRASAELSQELGVAVDSFPMRFHPLNRVDRTYVGKHWTEHKLRAFRVILSAASGPSGAFTAHCHNTMPPLEEFEYWLGKNADEFDRLLSYPKIRQLAARRKGALRMKRAKSGT
jgi:hypothetical protein